MLLNNHPISRSPTHSADEYYNDKLK